MHPAAKLILEIASILGISVVVAAVANAVTDRPIDLNKQYFRAGLQHDPAPPEPVPTPPVPTPPDTEVDGDPPPPDGDRPTEIGGFQVAFLGDMVDWTEEGAEEFAMVVDSRKWANYEEGHIPGAHHLDIYKLPEQFEEVRPRMEEVAIIAVYCSGGDCEDSLNLAHELVYTHQIDQSKLYVFDGGYDEWTEAGNPVVAGENRR